MAYRSTGAPNGVSRRQVFKGVAAAAAAGLILPNMVPTSRPAFAKLLNRAGGHLIAAQEVDPVQLDPATSSNFSAMQAYEHVYESLVMYDENLNIVPCLAESWETPDDTTYVFNLRKGVKFHNGADMTAADVIYSLERALDEKTGSPWRSVLTPITKMEAVDPFKVKMTLKGPTPMLLGAFAFLRNSGIIPKDWDKNNNTKIQAIGTGPFKLAEYVPTDYLRYEKFNDYWDKGRPTLDQLTLKVMVDQNARLAAIASGQIGYAVFDAQGAEQLSGFPSVKVLRSPSAWLTCHVINFNRAKLNDKRVRQALRLAVDTKEVIQKAVFGAGVASPGIATGYADWAIPESELLAATPNPQKAKQLLTDAGADGMKVTISCSPQYPEFVAISLICQESWRKIGVQCEVEQLEWGAYVAKAAKTAGPDIDIGATAFTFRHDPDGYVYSYYKSDDNNNYGYSNAEMDDLLEKARTTLVREDRKRYYQQIQRIIEEDQPIFYWYVRENIEAVGQTVQGFKQSFTQRRIFFKDTTVG